MKPLSPTAPDSSSKRRHTRNICNLQRKASRYGPQCRPGYGLADTGDQRSTCHSHRAVNRTTTSKYKLEATGIGATACSQHGCFVPHSVVDFQKGEWQMNMDYSLCQALKYNMDGISRAVVYYDIACQYFIHFHDRVQQNDHLEIPPNLNIKGLIGHFHINGHQDKCYT